MRCIIPTALVFVYLILFSSKALAKIVTTTVYKGKSYYVDVRNTSNSSVVRAEVWFVEKHNASSGGDMKMSTLSASKDKLVHYTDLVCRGKEFYDVTDVKVW